MNEQYSLILYKNSKWEYALHDSLTSHLISPVAEKLFIHNFSARDSNGIEYDSGRLDKVKICIENFVNQLNAGNVNENEIEGLLKYVTDPQVKIKEA